MSLRSRSSRAFVRHAALALVLLTASCAGRASFRKAEDAFQRNEMDEAVENYMRALQSEPENIRYRTAMGRSLISASNYHLHAGEEMLAAGDERVALYEFNKALEFNPNNNEALRQKTILLKRAAEQRKLNGDRSELEQLKERVSQSESDRTLKIKPNNQPFNLKMGEADLSTILRALQTISGIRILFDKDFQSRKLTVDLELVTFREALEKVLIQTKNFYKAIDERTIIIVPDTPAKRVEYNELIMRTFLLSNADPKLVEKELRDLVGIKSIGLNEPLNAITLRDTPQKVAVAERLIRTLDKTRAELLIDIEILEVNRRRMKNYGIELSNYYVTETLYPYPVLDLSKVAPQVPIPANLLKHLNLADFFFTFPSLAYKLMQEDTDTKVKAKPQLRVIDLEDASVTLGDRVPVLQTSFVPNYGTSSTSSLNQNPINSYTWEDVGIKIKIKPRVHHDGWVSMNLDFDLNFVTIPGTASTPPTFGQRKVKSLIRLHDNETGILAGLLRDNERRSARGLPGLVNLPVIKEIFASNDTEITQTDLILTITPRIIKFPDVDEEDLQSYYVGTEENLGLKESLPISPFDEKLGPAPVDIVLPPVEPGDKPPAVPTQVTAPPVSSETQPAPGPSEIRGEAVPTISLPPESSPAAETPPPPAAPESPSGELPTAARLSLVSASASTTAGQPLQLELVVENVDELQMVEGEIRFPANRLRVDRVDMGDFVRSHGGDVKSGTDNTTGKLRLSIVLGGMATDVRREVLAVVQFSALSEGEAPVDLPEMHVYDPRLHEPMVTLSGIVVNVSGGGEDGR